MPEERQADSALENTSCARGKAAACAAALAHSVWESTMREGQGPPNHNTSLKCARGKPWAILFGKNTICASGKAAARAAAPAALAHSAWETPCARGGKAAAPCRALRRPAWPSSALPRPAKLRKAFRGHDQPCRALQKAF